jgi:multiple sugar transport system ATP-binding protein
MAGIVLEHVHKRYGNGYVAVRDLSLEIADGELLVLVGPSGGGKSTALRLIAGLERVTAGRIHIGERDVTAMAPQDRDLAMVFQSYALYPHMSVRENLAFGLTVRKLPGAEIEKRIALAAESLGLATLLDRKPAQLSGGQRQRVALGRAIVREPLAFLFDEPLSNLDARLRVETRAELAPLHQRLGATMIYVTHDQTEAMTLGTRVAVLHDGMLQQLAPPMTLYREPANLFVAGFIGSPGMNFVSGRLRATESGTVFEGHGLRLDVEAADPRERDVVLGVRPHDLSIGPPSEEPDSSRLSARVWLVEALGSEQIVHVSAGDLRDVLIVVTSDRNYRIGESVSVRPATAALHVFDRERGIRVPNRPSRSADR